MHYRTFVRCRRRLERLATGALKGGGRSLAEIAQDSLESIQLLNTLTAAERGQIEKVCAWRRYSPQEQIIDRHSESSDVFFMVKGKVRVVNYSLSGREITFDDVGDGKYFGEMAAIDGEPRSASIMALTECMVAALPAEQFRQMLAVHPEIGLKVMAHLSRLVRNSVGRIMDLSTLAANNRVHAELLRMARPSVKSPNMAAIAPMPIHGDIASRVSTTRETVARVLNDLARQGILERAKDVLVIKDVIRCVPWSKRSRANSRVGRVHFALAL